MVQWLNTFYDPWGRLRNPIHWNFDDYQWDYKFDRGYTGHEHMSEYNLINMNGRVYDPWLGRMLSPDPILQAPSNSQNYNRYTYAMNNPLKYTDPTGYRFGPGLNKDKNGVPLNNDLPGYQEEGVFSFANAVYDQRGAIISFGYGGNNFNNNGFSLAPILTGDDTNDDGIIDDNYRFEMRDPVDNWAIEKGIEQGYWVKSGKVNNVSFDTGDGSVQLKEYEIIETWVTVSGGVTTGDRFSNLEKTTLGLAVTGGSVDLTTEIINRLSGTVKNADVVNFGKSVTKKFGFVGVGLTSYNAISDGVFTTGDGARILLSGATFIPYVGWAYGAVDIGVLMVTGTSVTDRAGVFVDEHWGSGHRP
jgi:RHS repeat-associated protein